MYWGKHGERSDQGNIFCAICLVGANYSRWLWNIKSHNLLFLKEVGRGWCKFWMFAAAMSYKNWITADKGGGSNSGHFVIVIIECPIWESVC